MSNRVTPDKRRYLRYEILDYAVVEVVNAPEPVNTVIADISLGGLQLRSKIPFETGAFCMIRVGGVSEEPIALRAEVRYCKPSQDSSLFVTGMKFIPESHSDRMAIAEYVHAIFERQCDNLMV